MEHLPTGTPDKDLLHMAYDAGKNNVPFEKFFAKISFQNNNKLKEMAVLKKLRDELEEKYGIQPDSVPLIRQMRAEN